MPSIVQEKALASGQIRSWSIGLETVISVIDWARRRRPSLTRDTEEMSRDFPTWLCALGQRLPETETSVESGELTVCALCGEMCVFLDTPIDAFPGRTGTLCIACGADAPLAPPETRLLAFAGQIPSLITGRPYLARMTERLKGYKRAHDPRFERYQKYFITVDGRSFFAPPLFALFPAGWPHSEPYIMVRAEYFDVLEIPADHVYYAGPRYFRFCNYSDWREVSLRTVLQQRVVPRILIDLIVADLCAVGRLDAALEDLDTGLHGLYNVIGKPDAAESLLGTLERHVGRGPR